ncbi:MAG: radical SAM protein [Ignisphaera sp.]
MRIKVLEITVERALSNSGLPDIDYALNPYIGCSHGCLYCYAKMYTNLREVIDNWGSTVAVKKNIIEVLMKEIKKVKKGTIGIGTITDPYQPVEALYRLTRKAIEILVSHGFKVSIQTKSSQILRDLDLFLRYRNLIDIGITITSVEDTSPMNLFEPYSSPPSARINALKKLSSSGLKTWIFYGPVIPGYNDNFDKIQHVLKIARETRSIVYVDKLRIKRFMWIDHQWRDIAITSSRYQWREFYVKVSKLCRDIGVECRHGFEEDNEYRDSYKKLEDYIIKK